MKLKKVVDIRKSDFASWFIQTFYEVSGKLVIPTEEELKEIADKIMKKLS